jgi:hypothetical protein
MTTEREEARDVLARQIRDEYLEMPGLMLTFRQAMRLWNLDSTACRSVLEYLVRSGFLVETRQGAFRRLDG